MKWRMGGVAAAVGVALAIVATLVLRGSGPASASSAHADYLFYDDHGSDHLGLTISGTGDAAFAWAVSSLGILTPAGSVEFTTAKDGSRVFGYTGAGSVTPAAIDTLMGFDLPNGTPTGVKLSFVASVPKDGASAEALLVIWAKDNDTATKRRLALPRVLLFSSQKPSSADQTVRQITTALQSGDCAKLYDVATSDWQAKVSRASFAAGCPAALGTYGKLTSVALSPAGLSYTTDASRRLASGQLILTVGSGSSAKNLTTTINLIWEGGQWRLKSISSAS